MAQTPRYLRSINGTEVAQNDLVAGLLGESLRYGPALLNSLHEPELQKGRKFGKDTQLMAAQEKIDSYSERELDWVFQDEGNLLVGYESKKKADLTASQLYDESVELSRVASDETILLVVITDDRRRPVAVNDAKSKLEEEGISTEISWFSWDEFLKRLNEVGTDQLQPQHEPLVHQLKQALTDEGYGEQFSELIDFEEEEIERFTRQQDQLIGLIQDLDRLAPEIGLERYSSGRMEIYHWGGSKSLNSLSKSYNKLGPENLMVPFVPQGFSDHPEESGTSSTYPGVHLHLFKSAVEVGIHLRPNKNEQHRKALLESSEQLVTLTREYDMSLFSFWNSWGISNEHHEPEEIESILTDERLHEDDGYRRVMFGWRVSYEGDSRRFVKEIIDRLELVSRISWGENRELFYPGYDGE